MANRYVRRCSAPLSITELQTQTADTRSRPPGWLSPGRHRETSGGGRVWAGHPVREAVRRVLETELPGPPALPLWAGPRLPRARLPATFTAVLFTRRPGGTCVCQHVCACVQRPQTWRTRLPSAAIRRAGRARGRVGGARPTGAARPSPGEPARRRPDSGGREQDRCPRPGPGEAGRGRLKGTACPPEGEEGPPIQSERPRVRRCACTVVTVAGNPVLQS